MALFLITVTEAPRTGQRKPRRLYFATVARTAEGALNAFRATTHAAIWGRGADDSIRADPLPDGEVLRLPADR